MLALALLEQMIEDGIVQPKSSWGEESIGEATERVKGGLDANAHAIALTNLSKVIGWAGKLGESYRLSRWASGCTKPANSHAWASANAIRPKRYWTIG